MTRPVRGFLTKTGQFFSTKKQAQTFEATEEFHTALKAHLEAGGYSAILLDFTMDKVREFVLIHKAEVKAYISLVDTIPVVEEHDLRAEVLFKPTAPVEPQPEYNPVIEEEDDEDFISAFTSGDLGETDAGGEASGGVPVERQHGEGEQGLPE